MNVLEVQMDVLRHALMWLAAILALVMLAII